MTVSKAENEALSKEVQDEKEKLNHALTLSQAENEALSKEVQDEKKGKANHTLALSQAENEALSSFERSSGWHFFQSSS